MLSFLCFSRNHLVQEIIRTQNELQQTKQALYTYESVGETFKKLLNQYTQLTMEIDNKKWALTELNKSGESWLVEEIVSTCHWDWWQEMGAPWTKQVASRDS